jgi:hypothetical protein
MQNTTFTGAVSGFELVSPVYVPAPLDCQVQCDVFSCPQTRSGYTAFAHRHCGAECIALSY